MKMLPALAALTAFATIGCQDFFYQPVSSGTFDPLGAPGAGQNEAQPVVTEGFRPGQFVTAMIPKTAFFSKIPDGAGSADRLLAVGTSMKVVSSSGSFLKVELDSGEVGYVPSIMVEDPNATSGVDAENPYSGYSLEGDFEALPEVPPGGNPPTGALPTVIDPSAVDPNPTNPGLDTIPDLPSAAAESGDEAAPDAPAE